MENNLLPRLEQIVRDLIDNPSSRNYADNFFNTIIETLNRNKFIYMEIKEIDKITCLTYLCIDEKTDVAGLCHKRENELYHYMVCRFNKIPTQTRVLYRKEDCSEERRITYDIIHK